VPQVASDPKIHAHSHNLARVARPSQQPDRAPSPFESFLDDGAQAAAPPPPGEKVPGSDSSQPAQPPAKTKDTGPAANDTAAAAKSDEGNPVDKPDCDGKSASGNKTTADAKIAEAATIDDENKAAHDDTPLSEQKSDIQTSAPPTDNVQTISAADAIAVVPTLAPRPVSDRVEHVVQLPEQASPVAEIATQSKPVDPALLKLVAGKPTDSGKPVDAKKQDDSAEQIDTDQSADEPAVDANLTAKSASQTDHKPQPATTENDNQRIAQARGEIPANSAHAGADAPATPTADANAAAAPKAAPDGPPPVIVSTQPHAAPAAAAPALLASQLGPQGAAIPLAGVPLEIASKALAGKNRFEIRLDPPELGRIDVRLDVDRDGNVTSRLTVDRVETLALLRRDASGLERALHDAGLKTADNGLQFALRDQSTSHQQTNSGSNTEQLVVNDETLPSIDASLQNYNRLAGQGGGLDIRV
jgi:flagellar hook-length control protein FliK